MNRKTEYTVAVVGATGAVGTEMIQVLEERKFPVKALIPLASDRSEGLTVEFQGQEIPVKVLKPDAFAGVDVALFSAGAGVSKEYGPLAVKAGAVVIDNSSAWRMDPNVPLVVPLVQHLPEPVWVGQFLHLALQSFDGLHQALRVLAIVSRLLTVQHFPQLIDNAPVLRLP